MAESARIEELQRRVRVDPASIAFAALAEEFRRVGRFEEAIEICRAGLLRHPVYLSARVTLGRALIAAGDYDAAQQELQSVVRAAPDNLAAVRGLDELRERLGERSGTALRERAPREEPRERIPLAMPKPVPPLARLERFLAAIHIARHA